MPIKKFLLYVVFKRYCAVLIDKTAKGSYIDF